MEPHQIFYAKISKKNLPAAFFLVALNKLLLLSWLRIDKRHDFKKSFCAIVRRLQAMMLLCYFWIHFKLSQLWLLLAWLIRCQQMYVDACCVFLVSLLLQYILVINDWLQFYWRRTILDNLPVYFFTAPTQKGPILW